MSELNEHIPDDSPIEEFSYHTDGIIRANDIRRAGQGRMVEVGHRTRPSVRIVLQNGNRVEYRTSDATTVKRRLAFAPAQIPGCPETMPSYVESIPVQDLGFDTADAFFERVRTPAAVERRWDTIIPSCVTDRPHE